MKKQSKYKLFIVITLNLLLITISAQNDLENNKKYWFYRSRFLNNFIKIGNTPTNSNNNEGHGESIPFNSKHACGTNFWITATTENSNGYYLNEHLEGGDATVRLGIYLSVLATEYRLLKNNNQNVDAVKHEIFCALNAINRLDYFIEEAFSAGSSSPNLNGFFMRHDIPKDFVLKNYDHFNYYNNGLSTSNFDNTLSTTIGLPNNEKLDRGFTDDPAFLGGVYKTNNDYPNNISEESQDQVFYLLMGLTLTNKLVDSYETDASNVFNYDNPETLLKAEAGKIANRLITHISNNSLWIVTNPVRSTPTSNIINGAITNALTSIPVTIVNQVMTSVASNILNYNQGAPISGLGNCAIAYSYPLDNLGCFIKYDHRLPFCHFPPFTSPTYGIAPLPFNPSLDYRNSVSSASTIGPIIWEFLGQTGGGPSVDEQGFFNVLAGLGNNIYNTVPMLNLDVEAEIEDLKEQIKSLKAGNNNGPIGAINALNNALNGNLSQKILDIIGDVTINVLNVISIVNDVITYLEAAVLSLVNNLTPIVKINTTDQALTYSNYSAPMDVHLNCGGYTLKHGSKEYFGIYLREILHGNETSNLPSWLQWIGTPPAVGHSLIKTDVENMLTSAPCRGNYNYHDWSYSSWSQSNIPHPQPSIPLYPTDPWGVSCFMDRPDHIYDKTCINTKSQYGDWQGLDYMLIHNMYYLVEGGNQPIIDYRNRGFSLNLPFNSTSFQNTNKGTVGAFEFLTVNNTVASNGGVIYRAGKEIRLLPNFSVSAGGELNAYIDPYPCSAQNAALRTVNSTKDDFIIGDSIKKTNPVIKTNHDSPYIINDASESNIAQYMDSIKRDQGKSVNNLSQTQKINLYPNPSSGKFILELNLNSGDNIHIEIYDNQGKTVLKEKYVVGIMKLPIDLTSYPKGIYLLKIRFDQDKVETKKITIQ